MSPIDTPLTAHTPRVSRFPSGRMSGFLAWTVAPPLVVGPCPIPLPPCGMGPFFVPNYASPALPNTQLSRKWVVWATALLPPRNGGDWLPFLKRHSNGID